MEIKHYLFNSFIIQSGDKKIAIDPGAALYFFNFKTLLPKSEWKDVDYIFVTHGDPDHHWYTDKVAETSNASVICNKTMVKEKEGNQLMLGPRDRGLTFSTLIKKLYAISVDETIKLDEMVITGIKTIHGPLVFKFGPFSKTVHPGSEERLGLGSIGFKIELDGKVIVNLGDTVLNENDWKKIKNPDVLMLPIGGSIPRNTMDEEEALKAVKIMEPKLVIPTHYNCPALFSKNYNPSDDGMFKEKVEEMGFNCMILNYGDSVTI